MMVSDEEKRWIVVGIAMNKVAAPVLRDAMKQGMDTDYANLDRHCQLLTPPCTLTTLNHGLARADPILRNLKFQNINNNHLVHGVCNYNFNIYSSVDLAKLYLPGYLAQFSAFDESLDMTAILRLLGFKNYMPAPVFSPQTQASADDVRENVRNKWGHVDLTEWTAALFNDCFDKVKTLVRSLGLVAGLEKDTLDQLADWQTKGCNLIMGHAVDKDLLCLVQDEVKDLIKEYSAFKSQLNLQNKQVAELEEDFAFLKDQEGRLNEHQERLDALDERLKDASEFRSEEITQILERLVSFEEHSRVWLQALEQRVYRLEQSHTKTAVKVEEVGLELKSLKTQIDKPEASSLKSFDLKSCRSKLEDHYRKTATIPTSVWSKKSVVDIHQIYTRLSWVKEEQTPAGTTQTELKHYCDLFKGKKNGVIPKRILVQGQTGIGKSTFVKKLLVDWVDVNNETGDKQAAILKNFELVVAINLKEVSKCQSFKDVIRLSNVFAKEDKYMTDGLVDYIANNQEKVLLIFDGYDEYRSGCDSEIYEIFGGNRLRSCCVLITTRISKSDELRGGEDLQAEITGFSELDKNDFMLRFLSADDVSNLEKHLHDTKLEELAKVPLLLLFFCILWRKGQLKLFPKTKTTLYIEIVQFIVNHSYSKQTPPLYVQLTSLNKILSEIGKVALQALLNDDHLFEYSQLSDSVRCDESVLIGLLQITEHSETLRPIGMVSFIHKSIQEFLAAWYITYRCIPEGGNLGEIGGKLEVCLALENVFQFVCGLSEDGASIALRHLKSVRISDPSLDMSKTIPDFENETDAPLSDVTERQCKFHDLVLKSYEEVESKAELSRACLDCLGSILISPGFELLPKDLLLKAQHEKSWSVVSKLTDSPLEDMKYNVLALEKTLETLVTESSEVLKITNFVRKFCLTCFLPGCLCGFLPVVCYRNDQVHFYITHLALLCNDHARLFVDFAVPSNSENLSSGQLCLKFLKTIRCSSTRFSFEGLVEIIKHCNHLERLQVLQSDDTLCHILEQVANPLKCSLSIRHCALTSKGAQKLAFLLPRFENVTEFDFCLVNCSEEAAAYINHTSAKLPKRTPSDILLMSSVDEAHGQSLPKLSDLQTSSICSLADDEFCDGTATSLYAAIKHKTLTELTLSEILFTSPVAEALGQSLPELSALQTLSMSGLIDCSDQAVTSLVAAIKHKTLERLKLRRMNLTSAAVKALSQSLPELLALRLLKIGNLVECSDDSVTRLFAAIANKALEEVKLRKVKLTSAAAEALGRSLPELPALKEVSVKGSDGCSLQHEEMEAMFGKFKRPFPPLIRLKICNFSARGTLAQLTRNLCFFPSLECLHLEALDMGEADLCSLLDNLKVIPNLWALSLMGNPLGQAVRLMVPYLLNQHHFILQIRQGDCSEEHLNYVLEATKATTFGHEIRNCSGTEGRGIINLLLTQKTKN